MKHNWAKCLQAPRLIIYFAGILVSYEYDSNTLIIKGIVEISYMYRSPLSWWRPWWYFLIHISALELHRRKEFHWMNINSGKGLKRQRKQRQQRKNITFPHTVHVVSSTWTVFAIRSSPPWLEMTMFTAKISTPCQELFSCGSREYCLRESQEWLYGLESEWTVWVNCPFNGCTKL